MYAFFFVYGDYLSFQVHKQGTPFEGAKRRDAQICTKRSCWVPELLEHVIRGCACRRETI